MLFISDALAADQTAPANGTTTQQGTPEVPPELTPEKMMQDNLMLLGLIFFIFYFMLIRPQQKRLKQHQAMMKSIQKGNKIVTSGGLMGTVTKLEGDDVIVLEVAQGVKVRVARAAVSEVRDSTGTVETANDN